MQKRVNVLKQISMFLESVSRYEKYTVFEK
jgi:hypothetical protein